jgi:hypothetical protein
MSSRGRIEAVEIADRRNTLTIARVIDGSAVYVWRSAQTRAIAVARQARGILDKRDGLCYTPGLPDSGRLAQLVEQLTLNQRVVGSIPTAPTKIPAEMLGFSWH